MARAPGRRREPEAEAKPSPEQHTRAHRPPTGSVPASALRFLVGSFELGDDGEGAKSVRTLGSRS